MTIDIERLNELHKQGESDPDDGNREFAKCMFALEAPLAWPAIAAELTRLREFEAAVRDVKKYGDLDQWTGEIDVAIDDLDRKRG